MDIFNTITTNFNHENYIFAYLSVFLSLIFLIPLPQFNRILKSFKSIKIVDRILKSSLNLDFLVSFSVVSFIFFTSTMQLKHMMTPKNFATIEQELTPLLEFFINSSLIIVPYLVLQLRANLNFSIPHIIESLNNIPFQTNFFKIVCSALPFIINSMAFYWLWLFISVSYHFYFKTPNTLSILLAPSILSLAFVESLFPIVKKYWKEK
ncbi:hypothetical protein [Lactococcus lactis]|uniref:hypothetical protein n=1 Tax=Lactococcus lactis TaxID=1358 RepID=UPI0022E5DC35|nr:hypothetical protein [Lactococcus lactis]